VIDTAGTLGVVQVDSAIDPDIFESHTYFFPDVWMGTCGTQSERREQENTSFVAACSPLQEKSLEVGKWCFGAAVGFQMLSKQNGKVNSVL
jgi:hypothetical protein